VSYATMFGMSQFDTVLISALTSAGVALAIEWAAKPRLEARKERILDQSKAKRDVLRQLATIVSLAASLNADVSSLSTSERRIMLGILEERRVQIITASKAADSAFNNVVLRTDHRTRVVISKTIGMTQGIASSDKLRSQASEELAIVSSIALDLYHFPRWRMRKRRKLFAQADLIFGASTSSPSS
jgi:hypothetical protein